MKVRILQLFLCICLIVPAGVAEAQEAREGFTEAITQYKLRNRHGVFSYFVGGGISTYYGDLKDERLDFWARPTFQVGALLRAGNHFHFRSELTWYRISGADSLNDPESGIYRRNLSFRADNFELNVVALYQLFNKFSRTNRPTLNPYVFAGLGFSTNNPEARYQGRWVDLRPLETEGVDYSGIVLVVPFGGGIAYHVNNNWDIYLDAGYRVAFTDYLDDVSTSYKGVNNFDNPLAAELSDRRDEIGLPLKEPGKKRGNSSVNDWYLLTTLKLVYTPFGKYRNPKHR